MKAQNNPIDIGAEEIAQYKDNVEEILVSYFYQNENHSLPELITRLDPEEKYVMNDIERHTYITLREGFQISRAIYKLLADKTELKKRIIAEPENSSDSNLDVLRGFCGNFAVFAASTYIKKKLDHFLDKEGVGEVEGLDLSQIKLQTQIPESALLKRLLAPVFANLIRHKNDNKVFSDKNEFPVYCRDIFTYYVKLAHEQADLYKTFQNHIAGYRFRIMDDFVALEEYEDVAISVITQSTDTAAFQRISADEIVGNRLAKMKIQRYIDRLALYDLQEQQNPVMELGGLSWTNLFDGPPGTGKSSMFRLAMTRLVDRCETVGIPNQIITVDQSIKDEFYGKTGKILLEKLNQTQNTNCLSLVIFDDIDLLTSTRGDAQGADNDINNIIMQYLDGVYTVRRGNVINFAASNKPTGLDSAMRNRFSDRLLVDGPVSTEDFADMFHIFAKKMLKQKLITIENNYEPFASQSHSAAQSADSYADYMASEMNQYKKATVLEFGDFMRKLKEENEFITGRSTKAIMDAITERSAQFDIPEDWFSNPGLYFDKPYAEKLVQLQQLYQPITPDVLFQEAKRYFDSEQRYANTESDEQVTQKANSMKWDTQAQIQFYSEQLADKTEGSYKSLYELKNRLDASLHNNDS